MPTQSVMALFEEQAALTPDALAVSDASKTLTYLEVNQQANQFAHYLLSIGVNTGGVVGVCVDRSAEMLIVVLGILKAGAAYLPLDPGFPEERLQYMLENAQVSLLVAQERAAHRHPKAKRVFGIMDDWHRLEGFDASNPRSDVAPTDLAYLIYTSGSTGTPKGVQVCHSNVVNFLQSMAKVPGLEASDRLLAITTISFDIHVLELFLPLTVGASVRIVANRVAADAFELVKELADSHITVMQATPTTWRMMIAAGWQGSKPFKALVGGEPFPQDLVEPLYQRCSELWNMYGPTETTVWSTCYQLTSPSEKPLVGQAIDNTQLYVVTEAGQLAKDGEEGELYIGGAGVTRGYHRLEATTRERFINNPFDDTPGPVYKTGDLARRTPSGDLEHLGRLDDQIKFHGYRIELGDIEAALSAHPHIEQAIVVVAGAEGSHKQLVAFYASSRGELNRDELRRHCTKKLPAYMVPNGFAHQQGFPLTPNLKVDRKALAARWQGSVREQKATETLPDEDFGIALTTAWQAVLECGAISVDDRFLDAGGDSIKAFQLVQEMEAATGVKFPLHLMLANPTIRELFDYASATEPASPTSVVPLQPKGDKPPVLCLCGVNLYKSLADSLGEDRPTYGIYAPVEVEYMHHALAGKRPKISVQELAQKYCAAILRKKIEPPHFLVGFSFGGIVAVETARLLRERGQEVAAVILLDTLLPHALQADRPWKIKTLSRRLLKGAASAVGVIANKTGLARKHPEPERRSARALIQDQAVEMRNYAYDQAGRAYVESGNRYDGKVVLIKAADVDPEKANRIREDYGWSDVLERKPELYRVKGRHLDIIRGDSARDIATILRRYLPEYELEHEQGDFQVSLASK